MEIILTEQETREILTRLNAIPRLYSNDLALFFEQKLNQEIQRATQKQADDQALKEVEAKLETPEKQDS